MIDTHQHLWDITKFSLPWIKNSLLLNRSYVTKDYLAACRGLGIVKAVYMEVAVSPDQQLAEAEHVIALCKDRSTPTAAAVIGGRPGELGFERYVTRFKDSEHVRGVRSRQGNQVDFASKQFIADIRMLGRLSMSFDICTAPQRLAEMVMLVDACPETRFVVDHCGNADPNGFRKGGKGAHDPDQWRRDIDALARRKNTICKISGIVAKMKRGAWSPSDLAPVINHCQNAFGPDRAVFGSDWPVCLRGATYKQWVAALKAVIASRPEADQRKLLHDNAVGFYRLGSG